MPVIGIPLDEFFAFYGQTLEVEELVEQLHRFGCSVEGWATLRRYRCARCGAISESAEQDLLPALCDGCGCDLRSDGAASFEGEVRVLKMELLAVRPDLFHPAGLARAMRGFLGQDSGAPVYRIEQGKWELTVDPALAGPEVRRPRIAAAIVHDLCFDDASLRSLMKLQENLHWALGRDRKLASIGVYDLERVAGPRLEYRAAKPDAVRFVPLGFDTEDPAAALTPEEILERHPKGRAFARLLAGAGRVPLLLDAEGSVLSMPPIINSEATRVTTDTRHALIDVTGMEDRHVERALNIVLTSLLEGCPDAWGESLEVNYAGDRRRTPDLTPQVVEVDPDAASALIGQRWSPQEVVELLRRMRHDASLAGSRVRVDVPAWRADILHPRDLIEDVAIAYGYDNLPRVELSGATFAQAHPREIACARARQVLLGLGAMEVMTLALSCEETTYQRTALPDEDRQVKLEHPISVEQTMLRISLIPGLMETLAVNLGHSYPQRLFEVGSVSLADAAAETGAREEVRAALALAGDGTGYADIRAMADRFVAEWGWSIDEVRPVEDGLFLPGRGAGIWSSGHCVARFGEVHPAVLENYRVIHPVVIAEFDLEFLSRMP
ncbi:MAG TPA: phenylalanine--tRNA ligase subunit beta [Acidobacteria bacterium]|nr:phenylalanine--tRNA ligase subunit beta [Acidobacteriota bacterium]